MHTNTASAIQYLSPEAYLLGENDRVDGVKYEYVNGQVYAMAGASRSHNIVAGNFFLALGNHLNRLLKFAQASARQGENA